MRDYLSTTVSLNTHPSSSPTDSFKDTSPPLPRLRISLLSLQQWAASIMSFPLYSYFYSLFLHNWLKHCIRRYHHLHFPVSMSPMSPLSCISADMAVRCPYPHLTLSAISILFCISDVFFFSRISVAVLIALFLIVLYPSMLPFLSLFPESLMCLQPPPFTIVLKYLASPWPYLTLHILCRCCCSPVSPTPPLLPPLS